MFILFKDKEQRKNCKKNGLYTEIHFSLMAISLFSVLYVSLISLKQ